MFHTTQWPLRKGDVGGQQAERGPVRRQTDGVPPSLPAQGVRGRGVHNEGAASPEAASVRGCVHRRQDGDFDIGTVRALVSDDFRFFLK